jgi:hypothetical protein
MNWYSILSATRLLGTAAAIVGVIAIVIFGGVEQKKRRMAEYKKSGRFVDLLKIFSKYWISQGNLRLVAWKVAFSVCMVRRLVASEKWE